MLRRCFLLLVVLLLSACGSVPAVTSSVAIAPTQTTRIIGITPTLTVQAPMPTSVPTSPPPASTPVPSAAHVTASKGANVRSVPATSGSTVLEKLPSSAAIRLLSVTADHLWYHITTDRGVTGWISAPLVSIDASGSGPVPVETVAAVAPPAAILAQPTVAVQAIAPPAVRATTAPTDIPVPSGSATTLHIITEPGVVGRGSHAAITIAATPNLPCTITVYYKSGPSRAKGLYPQATDANGHASWSWMVGTNTTSGSWPVAVVCGQASARTVVTVP